MASATANSLFRRSVSIAAIGALVLASMPVRADVSAADKAAAEALFDHAKTLMKDGRYSDACLKFQESQRIDPGIGTMLYLADCFEKNGQTASAWAEFLEAAAAAKAAGQAEREKKARDRASALEPKLNRLSIAVRAGGEVPGLEVRRDGAVINKALWGTPIPLDPGEHVIEATAPGKVPWSQKVKLDASSLIATSVVIPRLEDAPKGAVPVVVEPPKGDLPKAEPPKADAPKAPLVKPGPIVTTRDTYTPVRIVGGTFLGVGLATAGVGGILGMVTLLKKGSTNDTCHANGICTEDGRNTMNSARSIATGATVTLIAGAAAFTTGVIILVATRPVEGSVKDSLSVGPLIGGGAFGLTVGGSF